LSHAKHHQTGGAERGFTLVEALVALTLVATGLAAIGTLIGTSFRGTRALEQHSILMETARDIAASLPRHAEITGGGLSGETFGYRWRVNTRPYLPDTIAPAKDSPWVPHIVRIHVQAPDGAAFDLDTIRLQPAVRR
jgi:general secretion pathway protein I